MIDRERSPTGNLLDQVLGQECVPTFVCVHVSLQKAALAEQTPQLSAYCGGEQIHQWVIRVLPGTTNYVKRSTEFIFMYLPVPKSLQKDADIIYRSIFIPLQDENAGTSFHTRWPFTTCMAANRMGSKSLETKICPNNWMCIASRQRLLLQPCS